PAGRGAGRGRATARGRGPAVVRDRDGGRRPAGDEGGAVERVPAAEAAGGEAPVGVQGPAAAATDGTGGGPARVRIAPSGPEDEPRAATAQPPKRSLTRSRSSYLSTFPDALRGRSSTTSTKRGTL